MTVSSLDRHLVTERDTLQVSTRGDRIWLRFCPQPVADDPLLQSLDYYLSEPDTLRQLEACDESESYPESVVDHLKGLGLNRIFSDVGSVEPKATAYHLCGLNFLTARATASLAITVGVNSLALLSAYRGATPQQLEDILNLVRNGAFSAMALTELAHGSDLKRIESSATAGALSKEGLFNAVSDSDIATHYRLRARKQLINGGSRHELIILLLKCVYAAKAEQSSTREADVHSLFWIKREKMVGKPNRWHTLPAPAADITEVHVSDLLVNADHRIGSEGDGLTLVRDTLAMSRGGVAALSVGSLSKARDIVLTYARRRHLYGRPIAELGGIAGHLTRLDAIERAATAASLRATAWVNACGVDAAPYTAVAKMMSCRLAEEGITEGRHVLGARALLSQLPYARLIGDILLFGVFDGTSHIMLEELQMYLSKEVRARASGLTRQSDTVAEMRAVYALPMRSLAEVCRGENEFSPFTMLAHAKNISRLSGTVSLGPVAELAQLLLAVTEEAKHRRKWGEDQELRFALAEVYALIEVILGLIELFDPVRRESFSARNPGLRSVDDLGYRNALGWLGNRACSKLAECTFEAGLHTDPRGSRQKGATPNIADIQARFLDRHDEIRGALAEALMKDYRCPQNEDQPDDI